MTLPFGPLTLSHTDLVLEILTLSHGAAIVPVGSEWGREQVEGELRDGYGLGLWDAGRLLACVLYRDLGEAWEITQLGTHPEAQRRGWMARLLLELIRLKPKDRVLWLEVHGANDPARRLYDKIGFRVVGRRPGYYADGGEAVLYSFG